MPNMAGIISSVPTTSPDFGFGRALGIGIAKYLTESALSKTMVGNATFKSGLIKMAGAGLTYYAHKKINMPVVKPLLGIESTALTIDAVEDLIASSVRWYKSRNGNNASAEVEATSSAYI